MGLQQIRTAIGIAADPSHTRPHAGDVRHKDMSSAVSLPIGSAAQATYDFLRLALIGLACVFALVVANGVLAAVVLVQLGVAVVAILFSAIARWRPFAYRALPRSIASSLETVLAALSALTLPALAVQTNNGVALLMGNAFGGGLVALIFLATSPGRAARVHKLTAFGLGTLISIALAPRSPDAVLLVAEAGFGLALALGCVVLETVMSAAVADRKRAQRDAEHDPLTGLLNRKGLERAFVDLVNAPDRKNKGRLCLLYIDLDGFKDVNDRYGHPNGDDLLRRVGVRIEKCFRASDPIARIGGDEFVVLMRHEDVSEVVVRSQKIIDSLIFPFFLEQLLKVSLTASVGISVSADGNGGLDDLLRTADKALYEAKAAGKAVWRISGLKTTAGSEPSPNRLPA